MTHIDSDALDQAFWLFVIISAIGAPLWIWLESKK
jgi:hypothetical protein